MLLTVKDKEYRIPEKWNEVGLGMYQDFMKNTKDINDEHLIDLYAISAFTKLPIDTVKQIRKTDIDKIKVQLQTLSSKKMNTTLNTIINIDGVDYGFHPNLKDITFGEFVDLDNYLEDIWKNMHYIMAILYRPITKSKYGKKNSKYAIEGYNSDECFERAQMFRDKLSMATTNGAANFFLTIGKEYQSVMQLYLSKEQKKMMKTKGDLQTKTTLQANGVGTE